MSLNHLAEREHIISVCRRMIPDRLSVGTSGNVSIRVGEEIVITPSGVDYDQLTVEQISVIDRDGRLIEGPTPSTELPMHQLIYEKSDAGAVVHAHPLYGTALSTLVSEMPPLHYNLAAFGGPVRVADYATFGSAELAASVSSAMVDRSAVLMQNHGTAVWAADLDHAYANALLLEWLCELTLIAMRAGDPHLLDPAEIEKVRLKMVRISYGH